MFEPGSIVAMREVFHGRVWRAMASILVRDEPDLRVFWLPTGSEMYIAVSEDGHALVNQPPAWAMQRRRWELPGTLRFAVPGEAVSIWPVGELGSRGGWYVNLERPLSPSRLGYDYLDQKLDLLLFPDGTYRWKDEDHLEEAVALGNFTTAEAADVRAAGERVLERFLGGWRPYDDWLSWRPDPSWGVPLVPEGWDRA